MKFKDIVTFRLSNLQSRRKYYRKAFLVMKIYKTAKINLPKKSSSNSCIAKELKIRRITLLEVGKMSMNLVNTQLNHNKTENTTSHQTTRTRIRMKK